jgi:hypothetical protein
MSCAWRGRPNLHRRLPAVCRDAAKRKRTDICETGYVLDSGSPYRLLFGAERFGGLGDVGVVCWASVHSLLHETEKQLAPTFGFSPVKAKRKLVEVVRQMLV